MTVKLKFNYAGFDALRLSAKPLVDEAAEKILAAANSSPSTTDPAVTYPYYQLHDASDEHRARARVATTTDRARKHEAKTQALQKAL